MNTSKIKIFDSFRTESSDSARNLKEFRHDQKSMISDKRGDERVLSLYWFVILGIIAIGIVSGVLYVAGDNIDIRQAEAGLMRDRLVDCLIKEGELNNNFNSLADGDESSLLSVCKIDLRDNIGIYKDDEQYAISLELRDIDFNLIISKQFGKQAFFGTCGLDDENLPKCIDTTIYVLEEDKQRFLLIKTAVAKNEKNV